MKRTIIGTILFILSGLLIGCEITGYIVRVKTDSIEYSEISKIEAMLLEKGYELRFKEKESYKGTSANDINTLFIKKFRNSDKEKWTKYILYVDLFYIKDVLSNIAQHLDVHIYNHHVALIVPEIKTEIDNVGDLIYQELVDKVGKENVTVERKEWGPPRFY